MERRTLGLVALVVGIVIMLLVVVVVRRPAPTPTPTPPTSVAEVPTTQPSPQPTEVPATQPPAPPTEVPPPPALSREMPPESRPSLTDPGAQLPDAALVSLGKYLFFDRSLSGDRETNCATCHKPREAFQDGRPLSPGYPSTLYFRNVPTLLNAVAVGNYYWDGRLGSDLDSTIRDHITEAHFMSADGRLMTERVLQKPQYLELFQEVFGSGPSFGKVLKAVGAYVSTLNSGSSPYDTGDLSPEAARGQELFEGKAGCSACHTGVLFTDADFHNLGVPENPDIFTEADGLRHITFRRFFRILGVPNYRQLREDIGLMALTKREEDRGKFRTPSLRDVASTAPYMHNGTFETLEEVVAFYNAGGGDHPNKDPLLEPLNLTDEEQAALVAFLESLSSSELPRVLAPQEVFPMVVSLGAGSTHAPVGEYAVPATAMNPPPIGPLGPVPEPPDNPTTDAKVELGRLLFFDPRMSGDGSTACSDCHVPEAGWGDGNEISRGYPGTSHWRNSQTVVNTAYYNKLFWAGESTSLEAQAKSAWTGNLAGNLDTMMAMERMAQAPKYVELFQEAFGTMPTFGNAMKAVAAYERAVVINQNVPFDRYMEGDTTALSDEAVQGMELFQGKANCIRCHNGPLFSDENMHNIGVPKNSVFEREIDAQTAMRWQFRARGVPQEIYNAADRDMGLYYTTKRPEDMGKFRTPSVRYLCYTAPYMHNGVFTTLEEVVAFYNAGGGDDPNKSPLMEPLNLSADEQAALVAFLESLCGDEVLDDVESEAVAPYVAQP